MMISELKWGKDIEAYDALPIPNSDGYMSIYDEQSLHRYISTYGDMEVKVREGNVWFKFDIPEIVEGRELAINRKSKTIDRWRNGE